MSIPTQTPSSLTSRPTQLWVWFLVGFVIVFVGMLQFFKIYEMHTSGRGIVRINLWQYYSWRVPRLFTVQEMGPGNTSSSAVFRTLTEHSICAGLGGLVAGMIGWKVNRRRLQRAAER